MSGTGPYEFTYDVPLPEDAPVRNPSAAATIFQLAFAPIGMSVYIPKEAFRRRWLACLLPGSRKYRSVYLPEGVPPHARFYSRWDEAGCRVWRVE
jgi:hypothetical protein